MWEKEDSKAEHLNGRAPACTQARHGSLPGSQVQRNFGNFEILDLSKDILDILQFCFPASCPTAELPAPWQASARASWAQWARGPGPKAEGAAPRESLRALFKCSAFESSFSRILVFSARFV